MPGTIRLGAVLALLAAAVALPGCGSDEVSGEIPAENAANLNTTLASVRAEIDAGCTDPEQAQDQAQAFVDQVNLLPQASGEVKQELQEAADHLRTLVESECATTEEPGTTPDTTPTTDTDTTPTDTTPTETTPTDTTPTDTTPTETTPTDQTPPPSDGDGGGPPSDGGNGGTGGTGGTGGPGDDDE
jgi:hypothetical protein